MKSFILLFLEIFLIAFACFVVCNAMAILFDCFSVGFSSFWERVLDLPYLLYAGFSLFASALILFLICKKPAKETSK